MVMKTPRKGGFSLIELLVVLSLAAIGLTLAVPSWTEARDKRQLTGSSERLASFISTAQSQAVRLNEEVTVSLVHADSTDWCLGAALGDEPCDCTVSDFSSEAYCAIGGMTQVYGSGQNTGALMPTYADDTSFTFDEVRGILSEADQGEPHFFNLASAGGRFGLQVAVMPTGVVLVCDREAAASVPGYFSCAPEYAPPEATVTGQLEF